MLFSIFSWLGKSSLLNKLIVLVSVVTVLVAVARLGGAPFFQINNNNTLVSPPPPE